MTSTKVMIINIKNTACAADGTNRNSIRNAMKTKVDRRWSMIEVAPMRVDFMISKNNRKSAKVIIRSPAVIFHSTPEIMFTLITTLCQISLPAAGAATPSKCKNIIDDEWNDHQRYVGQHSGYP